MADFQSLQKKLAEFILLYKADKEILTSRLDELSTQVSVQPSDSGGSNNDSHGWSDSRMKEHEMELRKKIDFFSIRPMSMDFPRFDGNADLLGWITHCEQLFCHQHQPASDFIEVASFHLDGDAQLWFWKLQADFPTLMWEDFKQHCQNRFDPPLSCNYVDELSKLRHSGTVAEYRTIGGMRRPFNEQTGGATFPWWASRLYCYGRFHSPTNLPDPCYEPCTTL